jgi:hypothetical protein
MALGSAGARTPARGLRLDLLDFIANAYFEWPGAQAILALSSPRTDAMTSARFS